MCHIPAAVASSKPYARVRVDHAPAQGHSLPRVPESAEAIADTPDGETCYALSARPLSNAPPSPPRELRAWMLIAHHDWAGLIQFVVRTNSDCVISDLSCASGASHDRRHTHRESARSSPPSGIPAQTDRRTERTRRGYVDPCDRTRRWQNASSTFRQDRQPCRWKYFKWRRKRC